MISSSAFIWEQTGTVDELNNRKTDTMGTKIANDWAMEQWKVTFDNYRVTFSIGKQIFVNSLLEIVLARVNGS